MYTGLTAKISLGSTTEEKGIAYISNFSVEETRDIIEITKLGSKTKEKLPSLYSWTASAEGTADFSTDETQLNLRKAMIDGTPVNVNFYLNFDPSTSAPKHTVLTGTAYVESLSMDISAEDKGNISISLSGNGELVLTTNGVAPSNI